MNQTSSVGGTTAAFRARFARTALVAAVVLGAAISVPVARIAAIPAVQETIECAAPEPAPFPAVTGTGATPVASPVIASATPVATPAASPIASPVAAPGVDAQIERAVRIIAVCQSQGRVRTLSKFVTERFLSDVYAGGGAITREQFIALGQDLPKLPVDIRAVTNVRLTLDQRASADVVWTVSQQLFHATWTFVFEMEPAGDQTGDQPTVGFWLADAVTFLPVQAPAGADIADVRMYDNTYKPGRLYVTGPDVVLSVENRGKHDHEVLILKLDDGLTTQRLLLEPGPELPAGFTVIGQLTVPAGEKGQLVLVGLDAGRYAVVDLLADETGAPHLALGMETLLIVE